MGGISRGRRDRREIVLRPAGMERQTQGVGAREPPEMAETPGETQRTSDRDGQTEAGGWGGGGSQSASLSDLHQGAGDAGPRWARPRGCEGWLTPDLRAQSPAGVTTLLAGPPCWRGRGGCRCPARCAPPWPQ